MTPSDPVKELLREVRRLELRSRAMVDSLGAGGYRSRFKGQGMEFEEVREYSQGDDVRHIDWNVSARAGRPYVKTFREERELCVNLLVDVSGSMRFGAIPGISSRTKQLLAAQAAAIVAVSALRNNDLIGLVAFSDRCETHLRPRKGRSHAMRLVRECLNLGGPRRRTDPTHALEEFLRTTPKRSIAFLVSDFLDLSPGFGAALARTARRHDLIGLRIADPAEATLPASSCPLPLADPETGDEILVSASRSARRRYAGAYLAQRKVVEGLFGNAGCSLIDIAGDSVFAAIRSFFQRRRRRR